MREQPRSALLFAEKVARGGPCILKLENPPAMSRKKPAATDKAQKTQKPSAFELAMEELRKRPAGPAETVSGRWLLGALATAVAGSLVLGWLALCLVYWQGAWQLLYHPKTPVLRTPAAEGLSFAPVRFAAAENGTPQLAGWWVPAAGQAKYTVLVLHTKDGNLGDTVGDVLALHRAGADVLAFDYRGFGDSVALSGMSRPSEKKLVQDAEWALDYLTATRHVNPARIVVFGNGLGAYIAAEVAAKHASLAGVIVDAPEENPTGVIFGDARSRLVPAHLLVADRYDLEAAAKALSVPSLWLLPEGRPAHPAAAASAGPTTRVWLKTPFPGRAEMAPAIARWLDDLGAAGH